MAAVQRLKRPLILDKWSTREKLALACSVLRSGDQNWVSVSRSVKPFGDPGRHTEWFSQKNCAIQYSDLLEKVETPKRKRSERNSDAVTVDTPAMQIVRKLSIERTEELQRIIEAEEQEYLKLKNEIEMIETGQLDDSLTDMYQEIQNEQETSEPSTPTALKVDGPIIQEKKARPVLKIEIPKNIPEAKVAQGDPNLEALLQSPKPVPALKEIESIESPVITGRVTPVVTNTSSTAPPVSQHHTAEQSVYQKTQLKHLHVADKTPTSPSAGAPTLSRLLGTPTQASLSKPLAVSTNTSIVPELTKPAIVSKSSDNVSSVAPPVSKKDTDQEKHVEVEGESSPQYINVEDDSVVKVEEPISPTSSVSSRISDTVGSRRRHRGRGGATRGRGRRTSRRSRKDDENIKQTDNESSDADTVAESDDTATPSRGIITPSFLDSIPNSPASQSQCSDTEDEKAHRTWKKSIMLVWRHAANHRYANVFSHPVTHDIAPGYHSIVFRPKDLSTIKKNLEAGSIRTTAEFQRDVMLMFTNAIMYNNSDHDVFKMATEMYDDIMVHIEQYVSTQIMVASSETKSLRTSRRSDTVFSDKDDDSKRRTSADSIEAVGGKTKRRKTRADD